MITITIKHSDGRIFEIQAPDDAKYETTSEQVQQWKVVDDPNVGEELETLITKVHIDINDIEGRIKIEQH